MEEAGSRHILFVVGMHRSGTSALCAALAACGASFGEDLLDPMEGVNDDGFWEPARVVAVNEELLQQAGAQWFSVREEHLATRWSGEEFTALRERALALLREGFGEGPLEVVKDPRLCITLPFWTALCEELGLTASIAVVLREPLEIASSLQKRDAFPVGYGLRLTQTYLKGAADLARDERLYFSFTELLEEPFSAMERAASLLPLSVDRDRLEPVLRSALRHHRVEPAQRISLLGPRGALRLDDLRTAIERDYPADEVLAAFSAALVARGRELTRIGDEHTLALDTIAIRDRRIEELGKLHAQALATTEARDAQLARLNAHVQRAMKVPLLGFLFRAMWKYAAG